MRRLQEIFLKNYDIKNRELYLKARFVSAVTMAVVLAGVMTTTYSIWLQGVSLSTIVQLLAVLVMAGALAVLAKGRFMAAIHIIFTFGFASVWLVMFLESPDTVLSKADSVVLIIGLFSAMSLSFFKTRRPIVIYLAANTLVLLGYAAHLQSSKVLPASEIVEYFFDNLVALAFVFFISFNAVAIHRQVMDALRSELSQRKRIQKALSDNERKLADHLNNTPVGAIFIDPDYRVIEWNPSAERIFGYQKSEALGKEVTALIVPEEMRSAVTGIFDRLLSGQGGTRSENENMTKSGEKIICDWYNSALRDAEGRTIGAASLVNDITEKVKTQEMMIQAEKMMSVGGLAAGMAHEVNNPLSGMLQNAQLISQRLNPDIPANQSSAEAIGVPMASVSAYARDRDILMQLDHIRDAGDRAIKVIENMLRFSRKSDAVREAVDLPELMDSTVDLAGHDHALEIRYAFRQIELVKEYEADLPRLFCERTKVQQVLLNLFRNASDAMNQKEYSGGGPRLMLRVKREENHVRIEVEDNGAGMPPEVRKRVFDPFYTTKGERGTGLGLSISRHIITEDHGGRMTVDSQPGLWTRFTIDLPFEDAFVEPPEKTDFDI